LGWLCRQSPTLLLPRQVGARPPPKYHLFIGPARGAKLHRHYSLSPPAGNPTTVAADAPQVIRHAVLEGLSIHVGSEFETVPIIKDLTVQAEVSSTFRRPLSCLLLWLEFGARCHETLPSFGSNDRRWNMLLQPDEEHCGASEDESDVALQTTMAYECFCIQHISMRFIPFWQISKKSVFSCEAILHSYTRLLFSLSFFTFLSRVPDTSAASKRSAQKQPSHG
jgi:hypothetical protein